MAESFGCCGRHTMCQLTGECFYMNNEEPLQAEGCMLYQNVIRHKFPTLYKLKQKGLVEIQSNHLTTEGIEFMRQKAQDYDRLYMLLNIIYVMGIGHNSRLSPVDINKKLVESIKILNI